MDEPQVRRCYSWIRHATLVMLAHAIVTVITGRERRQHTEQRLIPLSFNEIRRMFAKLIANTIHPISHWLAWSNWRRRHQASAQTSHYRRRGGWTTRPRASPWEGRACRTSTRWRCQR